MLLGGDKKHKELQEPKQTGGVSADLKSSSSTPEGVKQETHPMTSSTPLQALKVEAAETQADQKAKEEEAEPKSGVSETPTAQPSQLESSKLPSQQPTSSCPEDAAVNSTALEQKSTVPVRDPDAGQEPPPGDRMETPNSSSAAVPKAVGIAPQPEQSTNNVLASPPEDPTTSACQAPAALDSLPAVAVARTEAPASSTVSSQPSPALPESQTTSVHAEPRESPVKNEGPAIAGAANASSRLPATGAIAMAYEKIMGTPLPSQATGINRPAQVRCSQ